MHKRTSLGLFSLALTANLVMVVGLGCGKPPPISLEGESPEHVAFPPLEDDWHERTALPGVGGGFWASGSGLHVLEPRFDTLDKPHFTVEGQSIRVLFDDVAEPTKAGGASSGDDGGAPAPNVLTITPNVPGATRWIDGQTLEFVADRAFDPEVEYKLDVAEFSSASGKELEGGFHASFRALLSRTIAGKTVHYAPNPGVPRVVWVRPVDAGPVKPGRDLLVLYDQPIELADAKALISLTDAQKRPLPLTLRHPTGRTFEGIAVDPRVIVLGKLPPLAPGSTATFTARGKRAEDEPTVRELEIPALPTFVSMQCAYDSGNAKPDAGCEIDANDSGVSFSFSNPLGWRDQKRFVQVTPTPRNLSASSYDETLSINAAWTPNTTYTIDVIGAVDRYGYALPDQHTTLSVRPIPAVSVLRDGVQVLDPAHVKDFFLFTRNVARGELHFWKVASTAEAFAEAQTASVRGKTPDTKPDLVVPYQGASAPNAFAEVTLDLSDKLHAGSSYLAQAVTREGAGGSRPGDTDTRSPSVPLFVVAGAEGVSAHVEQIGDKSLVQLVRLTTGEPVADAAFSVKATSRGEALDVSGKTDANGTALLDARLLRGDDGSLEPLLLVRQGDAELPVLLSARTQTSAGELFPALTGATESYYSEPSDKLPPDRDYAGFVLTDRGAYRPGHSLHVKAFVRRRAATGLLAAPGTPVRLEVIGMYDQGRLFGEDITTDARGSLARDIEIPLGVQPGRYRIRLFRPVTEAEKSQDLLLYEDSVRIAEFEPPTFKVDVAAEGAALDRLKAHVVGKYLYGAPMSGAEVSWSIRKKPATLPAGPLSEAGLGFALEEPEYWGYGEGEETPTEQRPITGNGKLGADGSFDVDAALGPPERGPTAFALEASVFGPSYRVVTGKADVLKHPHARYAGLKLPTRWGGVGPVRVELGVIDHDGKSVIGVPVEARLERLRWQRVASKAESGAVLESWKTVATLVTSCQAQSAALAQSCELDVSQPGDYRISARVDGHDDGGQSYYAYSFGDTGAVPSAGKKINVSTDKKRYVAGDDAKIVAQSPFAESVAILTAQQGRLISHQVKRVKGQAITFDLSLREDNVPAVHAVVTVLPIGSAQLGMRVGAVRIPVSTRVGTPEIRVRAAKKSYEIGEKVDVEVTVTQAGKPLANADVTLAIVDEGILRLTAFHAKDPSDGLRPSDPLDFSLADSRELLFRRKQKARTAGDGEGGEDGPLELRKDFVETLLWEPSLVTDADGKVKLSVPLKDNLTEFRMMATTFTPEGGAAVDESSFTVTRSFFLDPVLPQFAMRGDQLEIAAIAHNNTDAEVKGVITILGQTREITLPAHGHVRVGVPFTAENAQKIDFALRVAGVAGGTARGDDDKLKDEVVRRLDVYFPGSEEHPYVSGTFRAQQWIDLAIPADAMFPEGAVLNVRAGAALYPELGQRVAFLLDYPHGCAEQTTSGLLPLLAARTILPWSGLDGYMSDQELRQRIEAGVGRLGTMKTNEGGLAYWPGGTQPHDLATAYAARALLQARAIGIEYGHLLDEVLSYMQDHMNEVRDTTVKLQMAEVLASADALDPSRADALADLQDLDTFDTATLALVLAKLPNQGDRVRALLDDLERALSKSTEEERSDYLRFGSKRRDQAQALIALSTLRPQSLLVPTLARELTAATPGYTTQAVAWSLMAIAQHIGKVAPNSKTTVHAKTDVDVPLRESDLAGGNTSIAIPLAALAGKKVQLRLEGDANIPSAFTVDAYYKLPFATSPRYARHAEHGADLHRVFTDARGKPLNLATVAPGQIVRVALRAAIPESARSRDYFAITDHFAAGLEPMLTDLATVGHVDALDPSHPFYAALHESWYEPSHTDLYADRAMIYFDTIPPDGVVYATYLLRATTPGTFVIPSAKSEQMYLPGSAGFSDSAKLTILP